MVLQALEIVRIGVLFPFFSVAYIIAPHSVVGQTMRKPFIKFICHSASYFTFLCKYLPPFYQVLPRRNARTWLVNVRTCSANMRTCERDERDQRLLILEPNPHSNAALCVASIDYILLHHCCKLFPARSKINLDQSWFMTFSFFQTAGSLVSFRRTRMRSTSFLSETYFTFPHVSESNAETRF